MAVKIETLEGVVTKLPGNGFLDLNIQDALKEQKDARVLDAKWLNDGISHVFDKCCAVEKSLDDGFAKLFHSNSDLEAEVRSVKAEVAGLSSGLRTEVAGLRAEIAGLGAKIDVLLAR